MCVCECVVCVCSCVKYRLKVRPVMLQYAGKDVLEEM